MRTILSDGDNHPLTCIFDVDGVLLDVAHRLRLCPGRPGVVETTWDAYHARAVYDSVIPGPVALARLMWNGGYDVVLVTNRPEETRDVTERSLSRAGVPYSRIYMREDGGNHGSKQWVLERLHLPTVVLAVDDDRRHLEMYEAAGVPTLYVHSGYYDGIDDDVYYGSGHYVPAGLPEQGLVQVRGDAGAVLSYHLTRDREGGRSLLVPTSGSTWRGVAVHDARAGEAVEVRIP